MKYIIGLLLTVLFFGVVHASEPTQQDGQDIADQASSRIPSPVVTGVTNTRFQWVPGYGDYAKAAWDITKRVYHLGHHLFTQKVIPFFKGLVRSSTPIQGLRTALGISY